MNLRIRSLGLPASVLVLTIFCVPSLLAQAALPNGSAPTSGAFGAAGPSDLLNGYFNSSTTWIPLLQSTAQSLFWALATIDLTWTSITLVLQHSDLQSWMGGFIRKVLTIGFFAVLLDNGANWTTAIVNFFIGLGSTAGGRSVTSLSASGIMGNGVELAGQMLGGAASAAANTNASPIGLLIGGVGSFAPTIILAAGSLLIVVAYIVIALHFVMAMVEAYVVVGAGYIFLGFGGSRWTVPYTEKYMGMVVAAGVRIMVLELIIGLGSTLLPQWEATANAISRVPDIFSGGSINSSWSGVQAEFGLIASVLIFALLCWTIPQIAANVASGGLSMSGGDAISAASAAGSAAYAGAGWGGSSSASNAGSAETVQQIASAAAMRGADFGLTMATSAATGGVGAASIGVAEAAFGGGGMAGAEAAAAALTPDPPASIWPERADVGTSQVWPPDFVDAKHSASDLAGGEEVPSAEGMSSRSGSTSGSEGQTPEPSRTDSLQDVRSDSSAQADQASDRNADMPNQVPGLDRAQEAAWDAIRNAGKEARLAAIASGLSPQQAIVAERAAMSTARTDMYDQMRVIMDLVRAAGKMPGTGGPTDGIPPKMGHDTD